MILIKNKIKRIFSLLACALIIVSALPIGASAASGTFRINFGLHTTFYYGYVEYPDEVDAAIKSLTIEYVDSNCNDRTYDYTGTGFSLNNVYYGDEYDVHGWHFRVINPSKYEFRFELIVPGGYSFGVQSIPAAVDGTPGIYTLDLNDVLAKAPSATQLTFWFKAAALPPIDRTDYNLNYANVNIYTGSTLHSTQKVYAPKRTVGSWSEALYVLENDGSINLPDELNGYKIDKQEYGLMTITVDPDVVNTYNVYYDMKVNYSYSILYAVTPNGRQEISRLYAPLGWIGDYVYEVHDLALDEDIIPPFVDGYSFNYTVSPEYVTVYADRVVEYDLYYTDIGADKTIKINYYDQNGKVINQVEYRVSSLGSSFKIPSQEGYLFAPSSVSLTLGLLSESFDVYMIDFTGEREAAYQKGLSDGLSQNQDHFELMLKEAYDKGYEKGYSENTITQEHAAKIRKEYNLFTAFFDGAFGGLLQMYETITNGIAIGGVSLNNVISTAAVAVIVAFLVKVIL